MSEKRYVIAALVGMLALVGSAQPLQTPPEPEMEMSDESQ